ncbi:MAG: hypothetical protein ACP5PS_00245 [Bacteroidales bacterium]
MPAPTVLIWVFTGVVIPGLDLPGMPNLPVIENFYIKNPVTHKDSTLKIYIKAKVQQ